MTASFYMGTEIKPGQLKTKEYNLKKDEANYFGYLQHSRKIMAKRCKAWTSSQGQQTETTEDFRSSK
jgi:hypothetical protein